MTKSFDAVIVGGGPAGAFAAIRLRRLGWRIALIERRQRNQSKTCGHCLNARAMHTLVAHGLQGALGHGGERLRVTTRVGVNTDHSKRLEFQLSNHAGVLVDRARFDQALMDVAVREGVELMQPASARLGLLTVDGADVQVAMTNAKVDLHANLVIGADGLGSSIARAAGFVRSRIKQLILSRKFGFAFDLQGDRTSLIELGAIEMFLVPGGYLGAVNQGEGVIHFAALVDSQCDARDPSAFTQVVVIHHPMLARVGLIDVSHDTVSDFTAVGPMPWRPWKICNERVVLIGDAAGYVEPFTGEGMSWALASAEVLANVLSRARAGEWNERLAREYEAQWSRIVASRQAMCRALSFILARPRLARFAFELAGRFPRLTRQMVKQAVAA